MPMIQPGYALSVSSPSVLRMRGDVLESAVVPYEEANGIRVKLEGPDCK